MICTWPNANVHKYSLSINDAVISCRESRYMLR